MEPPTIHNTDLLPIIPVQPGSREASHYAISTSRSDQVQLHLTIGQLQSSKADEI